MEIINYETTGRGRACELMLRRSALPYKTLFLLPIPTTRNGSTLSRSGEDIKELTQKADTGTAFFGYGIPEFAKVDILGAGGVVCDSLLDERFLEENGRLTAEATLGIILTSSEKAVSDLTVGVVGYGRIGKRLVHLLLSLSAKVRVFTTKEEVMLDLGAAGIDCCKSVDGADLSGLDILINTAPSVIFGSDCIPPQLRIIELASGDNFGERAVERYPSLPAVCYPESAGRLWAESILRMLGGG